MTTYRYLVYLAKELPEEKLFDPPMIAASLILFCFITFIVGVLVL